MSRLSANRWGKSEVRVSKVHRGERTDEFSDISVQVLLEGDVASAHTEGNNAAVLPTDTIRNTIYGLAQEHLTDDLEAFAFVLCQRFVARPDIDQARVSIFENIWRRQTDTGFVGGGSERRTAQVAHGRETETGAGIEGLVVLKTRGSAFAGFPRDEFTILPEAADRLLATSITARWLYSSIPNDTTATWSLVRATIVDHFFADWSASVQHQGYMMGKRVLEAVPEISEINFHLPNQHHLPFDLSRFGLEDQGNVFHPVSEPYGDIGFTVTRD